MMHMFTEPSSCYIERTAKKFAIVIYHEHHFPLENVAVNQATAYARNIFVRLHLLQLAGEQATGRRFSHDGHYARVAALSYSEAVTSVSSTRSGKLAYGLNEGEHTGV